jgi:nitrogen regulatory protein PII
MKRIEAVILPDKLDAVVEVLKKLVLVVLC